MTQSVSLSSVENVSKNWTLFLSMTRRIEPFFQKWLKELNFFFKLTQRIEPLFPIWLKDIFEKQLKESNTLFFNDSKYEMQP